MVTYDIVTSDVTDVNLHVVVGETHAVRQHHRARWPRQLLARVLPVGCPLDRLPLAAARHHLEHHQHHILLEEHCQQRPQPRPLAHARRRRHRRRTVKRGSISRSGSRRRGTERSDGEWSVVAYFVCYFARGVR